MEREQQEEHLVKYLQDAHALEKSVIEVLERHANEAEEEYPTVAEKIRKHLEETRSQAERVEQCLKGLNADTSSLKNIVSTISGTAQGMSTGPFEDSILKNAIAEYSTEYFEIASYIIIIITLAHELGKTEVEQTCLEILNEEKGMAKWLEEQLPTLATEYFTD